MKNIDYSKELNQEQLDAVLHGDGPCLVLAGAGSGKTRTVTYRVAYLLEKGVDPASILLLTFTNKAAKEMLARIGSLVGPEANGVWGGTFHSVANRLLRSFASSVDHTPSFTILDQEDARSLIKAVIKDAKIDPKARRFPSPAVIQNVYSYSRNVGWEIGEVIEVKHPNFIDCTRDVEWIISQYTSRKAGANAMDFDDLLANWLKIMDQHPAAAHTISSRFQYILVDEFQDTNSLQSRLVEKLAQVHKNIFVVGDDAQSIYAFRGADVKNILAFPDQYPDSKIFKLVTNYRSTPQILEVANASLRNNQNQFEKDLIGLKSPGVKPTVIACPSARQEADFVAGKILELRSQGVALGNIAVLFRASSHSQALEFELMKRDVPFEYRGGLKFFERAHIKDVLAYLRLLINPKEETAWLRILNQQQGIGAVSAGRILATIRNTPKEEVFSIQQSQIPPRALTGWQDAQNVLQASIPQAQKPGFAIRSIASSDLYRLHLEREYPDWKDRLEDLEQLALFADAYPDVSAFLADAVLDDAAFAKQQGASYDDERVVLSTIHQAKGLEWDTVFIIHLTNMGFPSPRAIEEDDGLEEERRLFYVATTRARNNLYLTYPQTMGFDSLAFCRPSLFLDELPSGLTEQMTIGRQSGFGRMNNDSWSDDGEVSWNDEVIELDSYGNYKRPKQEPKPTSVWKKPEAKKPAPRLSFLRDVDDL